MNIIIVSLNKYIHTLTLVFYDLGGRDDSKLLIPATVLLRYMFTLEEMRVMFTFLTCDIRNDQIIKNVHISMLSCVWRAHFLVLYDDNILPMNLHNL